MECYVFTNGKAQDAIDYINENGPFPLSGTNVGTGETVPDQTLKWADKPQVRATDGAEYFTRIPQSWIAQQTQEQIDYFMMTFQPTIETFDINTWIGVEEQG